MATGQPQIGRRAFLQAGGISALGLNLPCLLADEQSHRADRRSAGTARSCIMLYMLGGPAQQETFDLKPKAPGAARSLFEPIATNVPGIEICELLPRLARQAHHLAIIRSTYHSGNALFHGAGVHYNLTGWPNSPRDGEPLLDRRDAPSIGAVIHQLSGNGRGLPPAVQLPIWITQDGPGREWAGQHAGFLGHKHDPLVMTYEGGTNLPGVLPPSYVRGPDLSADRLERRLELSSLLAKPEIGNGSASVREWRSYQAQAVDILNSGKAWRAFAIEDEKPLTRERYGDDRLGRSCLVARRLVEAGVRLVTVVFGGWDTHANHEQQMRDALVPPLDRAFAALLEDLDERGLLSETLVAWTGEFGRTPAMNASQAPGRDHWARVYSTVLAGGGIRGSQVLGCSDNLASEPKNHPVHVSDFVATIYHALGYGSETQVVDIFGRRHFIVAGNPLRQLF